MSTTKSTRTEYGVARGDVVLSEMVADPWQAERILHGVEQAMRVAHLEPDVRLVEIVVEVTEKRGPLRPYTKPAPEAPTDPDEPSDGEGETLPASGVWGDTEGE